MALKDMGLVPLIIDIDDDIIKPLFAKEGDYRSRGISLQILNKGKEIDTTGIIVEFFAKPRDGKVYVVEATPVDTTKGKYEIIYPSSILQPGVVKCEIRLVKMTDDEIDEIITTKSFNLKVYETIADEDIFEGIDIEPIVEILVQAARNEEERIAAENERIQAENARKSSENTRELNEQTRVQNENIRQSNEQTRQQNEAIRQQNEQQRIDLYNTLKDLDVSQYELRLQKLEHDTSVEEFILEEAYESVISLPSNVVNGQINEITLKGITLTNSAKNGSFEDDFNNWMRSTIDSTIVIDTEKALFGNKSVKIVTNNNERHITQNIDGSIGDKFYVSVWCRKESGENALATILPKGQVSGAILTIMTVNDFNNMPTGEWRRFSGIAEATNDGITILFGRAASTTYEVNFDGIVVINMTQLGIEDYTKEQMDSIVQNYFEGTKSTFGAIMLKSVGKNIWGGKKAADDIVQTINDSNYAYLTNIDGRNCLALVGHPSIMRKDIFNKFKPNTQYTIQVYAKRGNSSYTGGFLRILYTDGSAASVFPMSDVWSKLVYTSVPGKTIKSIQLGYGFDCTNYFDYDTLQIEEGTQATEYEPYKESTLYILGKDKEGNILELRSLPNGVKDEIDVANRKLIKRIGEKANVSSGTVINYTDMAEGGTYYAWNENGETETGIKGDTLGIDATALIYQLAQPIEMPVEVFGNLQSYENGTVYVDTIIPKVSFYDGANGIQVTVPIEAIDTLYKVDKETGYLYPLDISQAVIAEDRLSFTHPDLQDGDLVDIDYVPDIETTKGAFSFTLPTNLKASINSALEGIKDLYKQTYNLNIRVTANRQEINNDFNKHKENVDDYIEHLIKNRLLGNKTKYIAHRGVSRIAPENTLPAYEKAGELGFWGAECDVLVSADGVWVLHHDDTVDRMTDGTGNVSDFTLAQLKALTIDAGNNIALYPNLKIPTLEEYLVVCKKWGIVPVIEIKPAAYTNTHYDIFVDLLKKMNLESKAIVISFSQNVLTEIRNRSRYIQLQLVSSSFSNDLIDFAKALGNTMLDLKYNIITQSIIEECHTNDIMVNAWTVNDYNIAKTLRNYGVDFITTDFIVD